MEESNSVDFLRRECWVLKLDHTMKCRYRGTNRLGTNDIKNYITFKTIFSPADISTIFIMQIINSFHWLHCERSTIDVETLNCLIYYRSN